MWDPLQSCALFLTSPTSQYIPNRDQTPHPTPPPFNSHRTSGAVGPPPSSSGGLCVAATNLEPNPLHDHNRMRWQICIIAACDVHHIILCSTGRSQKCSFIILLVENDLWSVSFSCAWHGIEYDVALQHGNSLVLWSHLGIGTAVTHTFVLHMLWLDYCNTEKSHCSNLPCVQGHNEANKHGCEA